MRSPVLAAVALAVTVGTTRMAVAQATQWPTNLWIGTNGALASVGSNWYLGHSPTNTETVLLDADTSNLTWDAAATNTVASWIQTTNYTGTVTFATVSGTAGFTNLTVTGDMTLSKGTLTHIANSSAETYKLNLTVNGGMIIETGGVINVDGMGYAFGYGPGRGVAAFGGYGGGGHGGIGGTSKGVTYGSITTPTNCGSSGSNWHDGGGGGVVKLNVGGTLTVNGTISANGYTPSSSGNCSAGGGSVYIRAGAIIGTTTGVIRANGGNSPSSNEGSGGGGRVSVILTNAVADFSGYSGTMIACGGNAGYAGAAGTVYQETAPQGTGHGTLIIDNANRGTGPGEIVTLLPPSINLAAFSQIVIRNKGNLAASNDTLDFGAALINGQGMSTAYITIVNSNGVSFPNPYVISNYTLVADNPLSAAGNWTIASNGAIVHSCNFDTEAYKINLTINGSLTINTGGTINVDGLGYPMGYGPGKSSGQAGGGYGGLGGSKDGTNPGGPTYGSITAPTNIGSGASNFGGNGGGAVILTVTGAFTNHGTISVNGVDLGSNDGGSGGSIYITAGTIGGSTSGVIRANGGQPGSGAGSGGRVAVILTSPGADFSGYAGTMSAYGGVNSTYSYKSGAAGTVYRQPAGIAAGAGTVLVDNGNATPSVPYTCLPAFSNSTANIGKTVWVSTNNARLGLVTNAAIASLTLNANGYLDLRGFTLTVKALTVTNKVYRSGTYGPHDTPITVLTDSGSGGKVIIKPSSTVFYLR